MIKMCILCDENCNTLLSLSHCIYYFRSSTDELGTSLRSLYTRTHSSKCI